LMGATSSDEQLGATVFYNGSDSVASIACDRDGEDDAAALTFGTQATGAGLAERMRIDSDGNVGIGCDPSYALDAIGSTNYRTLRIGQIEATGEKRQAIAGRHYTNTEQDVNLIGMFADSTSTIVSIGGGLGATGDFNSATQLEFHTASDTTTSGSTSASMTIDSSGNVGIGGTAGNKLHVICDDDDGIRISAGTAAAHGDKNARILAINTAGTVWNDLELRASETRIYSDGATAMTIDASGNVGIGTDDPNVGDLGTGNSYLTIEGTTTGRLELSSSTADAAGASVGAMEFVYPTNSSGHRRIAQVVGVTDGATVNQRGGGLRFSTKADASGSLTERLWIDSDGDVKIEEKLGIGGAPSHRLQVLDEIKISSSDQSSGKLMLGDGSSTNFNVGIARWNGATNAAGTGGVGYFSQGTTNSGGHYFYTGDAVAGSQTERMRIGSDGNVEIKSGTLTLGEADTASGHINSYESLTFNIDTDNDDTNRYFSFAYDASSGAGTEVLRINETGRVTVKNASNAEVVDQASGTCDLSTSNNFQVTVGGTTAINLTNPTDGQSGVIKVVHDGANAITFTASQIKWVGGTDPTPSTTDGDIDLIAYYVDGDIYGSYLKGMAY